MTQINHSAKAVANTILRRARDRGIQDITPMKLQKLIYYAHAWCLAVYNQPLVNEGVEAWNYGPVIPAVYYEFKHFGGEPIVNSFAMEIGIHEGQLQTITPYISGEESKTLDLIEKVLDSYGALSPVQLSNMTHREGEPWKVLFNHFSESLPRNTKIPDDLIRDCFQRLLHSQASN